ncbi:MAG: response regulator transcription factor [Acidobacteriaceae bacterium]|jgi:DNA-binding NarL/FixJ family response regulator
MPSQERIRTFVVDDHQVVRMGLKTMLESVPDIELAGLAANAADALAALEQTQADVLLTDLHIGEMGGDGLIKEVLLRYPGMHCAVLTNYHSDEDVFRAIKAGALAYILKSAPLEQVTQAIRHVHAGKTALPPYIAEQLARQLSRNPLSGRETEILQYVAEGLNNLEIAKKLFISKNTVRNHVINVLEKLGTRDRTEAIAVAIRRGLVRINED